MSWHEPWAAEIKLAPKSVRKRHSLVFITGRTNRSPRFFGGFLLINTGRCGHSAQWCCANSVEIPLYDLRILRTLAGMFVTLGSGFGCPAERHHSDDHTSTVMSKTSIEPSPSSGEKPKCRSIKSRGAALLRSTQSSSAPQTAIMEAKAISPPRAVGPTTILPDKCARAFF